jgi:hypothetical protein
MMNALVFMRKQTWFACVVCVLALVPGIVAGGLAVILYKITTSAEVGSKPDFFLVGTLFGLFGIETPSKLFEWIFYSAVPAFLRGAVMGGTAVTITHYAYKGTRLDLAAFVTGGLYTGVAAVNEFLSYAMHGPNPDMISIVIEVVGLWVGLISVGEIFEKPGGGRRATT